MDNWEKAIYVVDRIKGRLKTEYPVGLPPYSGYLMKTLSDPGDSGIIRYLSVGFSEDGHTIRLKYIFNQMDLLTEDGQELADASRVVITMSTNSSYPNRPDDGIIIDDNRYTYNTIRDVVYTSTEYNLKNLFYNGYRLHWQAFVFTSNGVWTGIRNLFGEFESGQQKRPK